VSLAALGAADGQRARRQGAELEKVAYLLLPRGVARFGWEVSNEDSGRLVGNSDVMPSLDRSAGLVASIAAVVAAPRGSNWSVKNV
jgi:hypothetical protein